MGWGEPQLSQWLDGAQVRNDPPEPQVQRRLKEEKDPRGRALENRPQEPVPMGRLSKGVPPPRVEEAGEVRKGEKWQLKGGGNSHPPEKQANSWGSCLSRRWACGCS